MNQAVLETFYGAAARSMSQSWHNFFFGAFDPWGTVTVDKLPGAFWIQAISLRMFGFHIWAIVLPQVVEGTITVLVLYRAVRRIAGPAAGLTAAVALAVTPVTILLNRGNISDSLLILLLVLAADAATAAFKAGRLPQLVVAGVWVGLAFQAKMIQAWLVLPGLYLAYLVAAPVGPIVRRVGHVAVSALVVLVVSLSWMTVVTLIPAHDRPYADGSCNNSVYSEVFLYNGFDRATGNALDQPGCSPPPSTGAPSTSGAITGNSTSARTTPQLSRDVYSHDIAWLVLPSLAALVAILVARRREPRTDPWRAATLLWGLWLVLTAASFAGSQSFHPYYLAGLAPPMAALCGMGLALAWRHREQSPVVAIVIMATVIAGVVYSISLVPDDVGVRPWIIASSIVVAFAAVVCLTLSLRTARRAWELEWGLVLSAVALLLGAAWASGTAVVDELGPFDSAYQPAALTAASRAGWEREVATWPALAAGAAPFPATRSINTMETSADVSVGVLATGREFLPVGGFSGRVPSTPLSRFVADVRQTRVRRRARERPAPHTQS